MNISEQINWLRTAYGMSYGAPTKLSEIADTLELLYAEHLAAKEWTYCSSRPELVYDRLKKAIKAVEDKELP